MRNFYNNLKQMVMVGNNPDSILSRFCLVSLILLTIGVGSAWGAWSGSGQGTNVDGTWYVLHETGVTDLNIYEESTKNLSGPGAQLTFDAKRQAAGTGNLTVKDNTGHQYYSGNPGHKTKSFLGVETETGYDSYGAYSISNVNTVTSLTFKGGATLHKYVTNIKVTMAQYLENPSETSLDCGTNELGKASTNNSVTVAWCNVPAMSYSITDDADGVFSVEVSNNSEAGKYNTATFTVTCNHTKKAADNHTAKLVITDTYGSYNKTVNLSATTTKHPNSISWTEDESTKKNWEQEMTMTATASNTDYTNYPIQYSSSNNAYASVSGNVVTFHAAGAGQTVTIYANQATSATYLAPTQVSKTFTIKASQNIVWDAKKVDTNIRAGKSRDINGYAYGEPSDPNGVRVITYSSSNSDTISVSGTTITAKSLIGSVDIIATLAGDADYNEVTSRKTFTVKERETVEYYFDGALIEENAKLNLLVGDTSGVVTSKNTERAITYTTSSSAVAIYNTETKRIEAKGEGEATIHLIQEATDDYQNGNRAVVVKVALHTTTITTNVSDTTMEVGDTYDPKLSTTNDTAAINVSSTSSAVAVYEDGVIKAKGEGKATIMFWQEKTTKWSGDTVTIAVTVNKKNPTITVSSVPETAWNQTITPVITSTNTDEDCAITFEKISGADAAARQFGEDIKVYDKNGEKVTFRVTQTGNGKWNEATKDFSFTVQKASNHVTFTYGSNLSASKGKETSIIEFTGVPSSISCGLEEDAILDTYFYLYEATSASGQFTQVGGQHKNGTSLTESLSPSTRAIKFKFDGASGVGSSKVGTFKNITITERKEITVEGLTNGYYDFGSSYEVGNPATDKAVTIKCYSEPTTTVTSSNPGVFDVITETVNSEIDKYVETSITIRYHHKKVTTGNYDEATITLTSENGYTKTFKVKGKTNKKDQTLIWQDELTPISVGDVIPNPAIAPLALNYSIAETSAEDVVEVVDGVLKAKKVGTVKLHVANDGDAMWNPIQGDYSIKVTNLKVQRLNWDQTFTRLKTGDADVTLNASVYERNEAGEAVAITARSVTYSSDNTNVVSIVNGKLHIVGVGTANLTARVAGVEGEYEPAEVVRKVKVRTASTGCNPTVYADANGYDMKTSITDFTGTEKIHKLNGEPASVSFRAWRVAILGFSDGDIFVGQSKDNGSSWQELKQFSLDEGEDKAKDCGPVTLDRNATHIKIYKKTGATGYHDIRNIEVTKAKYLELEDVANRTTTSVAFDDSHLGQTYIQSVVVNYSNIYDMLYVNHTNKNFRITPTEIGNSCGEDSRATITIIYYAKDAITEKDTITVTDEHGLTATIYVSASVAKSDQTITWNPETALKTTDNVSFDASASSELDVTYSVREQDAEVATVTEAGVLTIKKAGEIQVTASQAGSNLYNPTSLTKTFTISKVTPSVSVLPSAPIVTLPNALSASVLNVSAAVMVDDKSNEVAGSYAWTAPTTALVDGAQNCEVTFTPTKTDWYNPTTFNVSVTANKRNQVITWDVADGKTWPCSEIIELNAVLTDSVSGDELEEALTYSSNNTECAEILEGQLYIKTPGTVTITVSRAGSAVYNAASITRTFTFEKVAPKITTLPTAYSIYQEQWLHESALVGGAVTASGHEVAGHFVWTTENFVAIHVGTQNYAAEFVPANEACYYRVPCEVPMTILQFERVFTDSLGNENWNDSANWSNGFVPPAEVSVTIGANVKIDTEDTVQVGTMTVNEGKTVTVTSTSEVSVGTINLTEGSTLVVSGNSHMTIGNSTEDSNEQYGDVYVKESATLTIDNSLKVNNVIMEATLNGGDQDATSSQIEGADKMEINGDAFIDITFDPNGQISYGWYDFVVPFEVNMHGGIARINSADNKVLVYNVDFVLIEADEVARAQGGKAWKRKNSGVLVPGKLYSISFDDEVVQNTFRFTWNRNGSIANSNSYDAQFADAMDDGVKGWNGMGNGMMRHGRIADGMKMQAYNHANNVYELVDGDKTFAVGTAFFVQATQAGTINWTAASADNAHPLFAPARAPKATEEFKLTLRQDGARKAADILYFSASEEATETYMIGHDLVKMGTPTEAAVAQMWTTKGGKTLCDVEKKLENDNAATPLMFFAPKAQEFTLSVEKAPADADLYLTYNDNIIWDLSANPYIMDLSKGTTSGYGLLMMTRKAPAVATGVDNADANSQKVRKVLVDGQLYIITPEGAMYNVTGKIVR